MRISRPSASRSDPAMSSSGLGRRTPRWGPRSRSTFTPMLADTSNTSTSQATANDSWSVPGSSDYAVQWTNPNPQSENVTYAFQLVPPPLDLWPLYLLLVAPLAMGGALIWYSRRKKRRSHWPVGRGRRAGFQKIDIQDRRYIICAPSHGSR